MTQQPEANEFDEFRETAIFRLVCCVMVIDGVVTKTERACIKNVVQSLNARWSPEEVDQGIDRFIDDIKTHGFRKVQEVAFSRVHSLRLPKWRELVIKFIDSIAKADGVVGDRERELCDRIRQLVT